MVSGTRQDNLFTIDQSAESFGELLLQMNPALNRDKVARFQRSCKPLCGVSLCGIQILELCGHGIERSQALSPHCLCGYFRRPLQCGAR